MFFLTDAEAEVLPDAVVVRAIPSLRRFDGDELTEAAHAALGNETTKRWLLAIPPNYALDGTLRDYVERHADSIGKRHLANQRSPGV
jgi:hypothetical protein